MIGLKKTRNFGIGVDNVIEFLGKIIANLFNESENVVTNFVLTVLLLAKHCQGGENYSLEELQENFVPLSVDQIK